FLHRQKSHADRILARRRQRKSKRLAFARKKLVRNLNQHARTVASLRIATAGSAVGQIDQDLNALLDNLMTFLAAHASYEPDAAGVMLVGRVIKTLRRRQTVDGLPLLQRDLQKGVTGERAMQPVYIFVTAVWGQKIYTGCIARSPVTPFWRSL